MKFTIVIVIGFLILASCNGYKKASETTIKRDEGMQFVANKKENISIKYYGDYWFHDLTKKVTLNWDQNFINSIGFNKNKKALLFTAHTTIDPYCTTIGLSYKNCLLEETVNDISEHLKKDLKAVNLTTTTETIGAGTYTKLSYELRNDQNQVFSKYIEYYSTQGGNVLRVVFWSTESNENWLVNESKAIIETIKSNS